MSDFLDYNGLSTYDGQIKAYINSISGNSTGVKIIQLDSTPTSTTLTYEIDDITYLFKKGDEAIVVDNNKGTAETNYFVVYKLYDISNGIAYWGLAGSGSGGVDRITEKAVITLTSTDYSSELIGASVTVTVGGNDSDYTWDGTAIEVNVPYGVAYSVSVGNKSGFTKPTNFEVSSAVMGFQRNITMTYTYSEVQVTIGTNQSNLSDLVNGNATLTMAGNSFVVTNSESNSQVFKTHVAIGDSVSFAFTDVNGYKTPTIATTTADTDLTYSVNYEATVVNVVSVVDSTGGKSSSDVIFTVNETSVASGNSIKIATGTNITISSTDLSSFGYGVSISPASGTVTTGANMTFTATYAYGSVFTAQILSNLTNDTSLSGESIVVSYDSVSETLTNGQTLVIPPGKNVTCVFSNVDTDYKKPSNLVFTTVAGTNFDCTGKVYQTEVLTLSSMTTDAGSITGLTVIVNGITKTYGTDTMSWKIPFDASDAITTSKAGFNVTITKNPNTDVADSISKDLVIAFAEIKNGVFAAYADGTLKEYGSADSNAIGVAVITDNCSFIIDKVATNNNATIKYGGYNKDLSSTAVTNSDANTAKQDFSGELNTTNIINACSGYNDGYTTGAPAAEACRSAFNGHGYMGSLGEWQEAYNNKSAVDLMMTKIGGTAIKIDDYHWTSTHYNASSNSWWLSWDGGRTSYNYRNTYRYVRAFRALSL